MTESCWSFALAWKLLAQQIRERLNQLRAEGLPIPDDLVELEKRLEEDCGA